MWLGDDVTVVCEHSVDCGWCWWWVDSLLLQVPANCMGSGVSAAFCEVLAQFKYAVDSAGVERSGISARAFRAWF